MIMATAIVRFSNNKIKKYHKGDSSKTRAYMFLKQMETQLIKYMKHTNYLCIIWDGKNRPWREE